MGLNRDEERQDMINQKVTLRRLVDRTLLSRNKLAGRAGLYTETIRRAIEGESVQRTSAVKLLTALNDILGTHYELEDIEGLHISGEDGQDE